jgi:hypothetical protein
MTHLSLLIYNHLDDITNDLDDRFHDRAIACYRKASTAQKKAIDEVFSNLFAFSLSALIQESQTGINPEDF